MIFEREISIEGMKRLSAQDLFHVEEPLAVPSATTIEALKAWQVIQGPKLPILLLWVPHYIYTEWTPKHYSKH